MPHVSRILGASLGALGPYSHVRVAEDASSYCFRRPTEAVFPRTRIRACYRWHAGHFAGYLPATRVTKADLMLALRQELANSVTISVDSYVFFLDVHSTREFQVCQELPDLRFQGRNAFRRDFCRQLNAGLQVLACPELWDDF